MALVTKLLMVASTGKLRKCLNPQCPVTPYFVADHGKTQYCSEGCGRWGQRQAKLKYWRETHQQLGSRQKGKRVIKAKRLESRRTKNVTQETR